MKTTIMMILAIFSLNANAMDVSISGPKASYLQQKHVFNGFGCTGSNSIPEISWKGLPKGSNYVSVTIYDPDAPTGGGWWHWTISNIPTKNFSKISQKNHSKALKKGAVESMTSFGKPGYGGPCPPKGDTPHRYVFTVYAHKDKVDVNASSQPGLVGFMLNSSKLTKATSTLLYGR